LNRAHEQIEAAGAGLFLVGQATPRHAAHYKRRFASELTIYADEERASYEAMGMPRVGASGLIGPKSLAKGLSRTVTSGVVQGRIIGDVAQLGGTALVMPGGEIAWAHLSHDASDNASVEEILAALKEHVG
jgi:hypothetical protein